MENVFNVNELYDRPLCEQKSNEWKRWYYREIKRLSSEYSLRYQSSTARSEMEIVCNHRREGMEDAFDIDVVARNNPKAEALLLIEEMCLILDKTVNFLFESKVQYVAYRYGLLGHMFNEKELNKGPECSSEVVLKLLGKVKYHGLQKCFRISLEHNSDFLVFCCENPPVLTAEQQNLCFLMRNTSISRKAEIMGVPFHKDSSGIDIVEYHDYVNTMNDSGQILLTHEEFLEYFIEGLVVSSDRSDAKIKNCFDYIFSDTAHHRKVKNPFNINAQYRFVNPEVFKLMQYIKPFLNNLWDKTERSPQKDEFREPQKVYSSMAGAVHTSNLQKEVLDAFKKELTLPKDHFDSKYDPFYMKTLANKEDEEPLYFLKEKQKRTFLYYRLLQTNTPLSQLFSRPIVLKDGVKIDPFDDYEEEIQGSPRLKIVKKFGAYPKRVWNRFFELVHRERVATLPEAGASNTNIWKMLDIKNAFYCINLQEECHLHLFKAIVDDGMFRSAGDAYHELVHQSAQFIVSLCWETLYKNAISKYCIRPGRLFQSNSLIKAHNRLKDDYFEKNGKVVYPLAEYDNLVDTTRVIMWPVALYRLQQTYPWLFYGVNSRAFATIGAYHEFAEHMYGPLLMEGYLWSVPLGPSLTDYSESKAPYLQSFTTNIFLMLKAKYRFGLRAADEVIKEYPYQLKDPSYIKWLRRKLSALRLSSIRKFSFLKRVIPFKSYRTEFKLYMYHEDMVTNFMTDPRYIMKDYIFDFKGTTIEGAARYQKNTISGKEEHSTILNLKGELVKNHLELLTAKSKATVTANNSEITKLIAERDTLTQNYFGRLCKLRNTNYSEKVSTLVESRELDPLVDKINVKIRSAMAYSWRDKYEENEIPNVDFEGVDPKQAEVFQVFMIAAINDVEARQNFLKVKGLTMGDFLGDSTRSEAWRKKFLLEILQEYSTLFHVLIVNTLKLKGTIKENCAEIASAVDAIKHSNNWAKAYYARFKRKRLCKKEWAIKVVEDCKDLNAGANNLIDNLVKFLESYITRDLTILIQQDPDTSLQEYHKQLLDTCREVVTAQLTHQRLSLNNFTTKKIQNLEFKLDEIMKDNALSLSDKLIAQEELLVSNNLDAETYDSYLAQQDKKCRVKRKGLKRNYH